MTTHALLTRFTKPIFLDLYLPDTYDTGQLMFVLQDKLDGKDIEPEKVNRLNNTKKPSKGLFQEINW